MNSVKKRGAGRPNRGGGKFAQRGRGRGDGSETRGGGRGRGRGDGGEARGGGRGNGRGGGIGTPPQPTGKPTGPTGGVSR